MSPTSPALSPPPPRPASQPQLQPGLLLEAREGLPSPAGQATLQQSPPQALLGRRPDWAAGVIWRETATRPACRMPAVVPSSPRPARDTHTHTHSPSPPHRPQQCLLEASITRERDIRLGSRTAFLHRKGRQPVTALAWLLPWFHRASSAAGLIPANTEVCV